MTIEAQVKNKNEAFDMMLESMYGMAASMRDHKCEDENCEISQIANKVYNFLNDIKNNG